MTCSTHQQDMVNRGQKRKCAPKPHQQNTDYANTSIKHRHQYLFSTPAPRRLFPASPSPLAWHLGPCSTTPPAWRSAPTRCVLHGTATGKRQSWNVQTALAGALWSALSDHNREHQRRVNLRERLGGYITCCCSDGTLTSHGKNRRSCTSGSHSERSQPMSCNDTTQHTGRGICRSFERQILVQKRRKKSLPSPKHGTMVLPTPANTRRLKLSASTHLCQHTNSTESWFLQFGEICRVVTV